MNSVKLFFCLAIVLSFNACTTEVLSESNPSGNNNNNGSSFIPFSTEGSEANFSTDDGLGVWDP